MLLGLDEREVCKNYLKERKKYLFIWNVLKT
jgi:hypothetical protein